MDQLEAANTWEVTYSRVVINQGRLSLKNLKLPLWEEYQRLADRSLGHALGPLAILIALGYKPGSPEVRHLTAFFANYLIVKQLNDDAHDWQKDLKMGHLTPVVVMLLEQFKRRNPSVKEVSLKVLIPQLQKIFWHQTIVQVCQQILFHVQKAKDSINKITIISDPTILLQLLAVPEQATKQALKEHAEAVQFLKHYQAPLSVNLP